MAIKSSLAADATVREEHLPFTYRTAETAEGTIQLAPSAQVIAFSGGQFKTNKKKPNLEIQNCPRNPNHFPVAREETVSIPNRLKIAFVDVPPKSSKLTPFN